MYGVDTTMSFSAQTDGEGFQITLARDNAALISGMAADMTMLFRMSQDLRNRLNDLGYKSQPQTSRLAGLAGGLCWGPASPLDASLIGPLVQCH
jgi:hypothetical protein